MDFLCKTGRARNTRCGGPKCAHFVANSTGGALPFAVQTVFVRVIGFAPLRKNKNPVPIEEDIPSLPAKSLPSRAV